MTRTPNEVGAAGARSDPDRCDRCGARAYVVTSVQLPGGAGRLAWCAHHFNRHGKGVLARGGTVLSDRRHLLAEGGGS